ncbi:hypothetical protein COOONC_07597 [Cooperia oncophora]
MRSSLQNSEQEDEVPQDPAPILSVLCSLVDEIGSLRTENRRLKIRLAPPPSRSKNVVQRVSAIFDSHTSIFPRAYVVPLMPKFALEQGNGYRHHRGSNGSSSQIVQDPLTTSSISTDFSQASSRTRAPPLVQPESDSEVEDYPVRNSDHFEPLPYLAQIRLKGGAGLCSLVNCIIEK